MACLDYLEILVVVSGSCPITGNSLEARHSYSKENLRYKSRFAPCVRILEGAHQVGGGGGFPKIGGVCFWGVPLKGFGYPGP